MKLISEALRKVINWLTTTALPYVVKSKNTKEGLDSRVIVLSDPKSYICEQYRKLTTNLEFVILEKKIKSLLITSAMHDEGKTIASANLATLFSRQAGKKVLLIDGDLRRPGQHRIFNIPRKAGLTDILINNADPDKVIRKVENNPQLFILPSGSMATSPVELFSAQSFRQLIENFKQQFDCLIIDTPPLIAVTDASLLAEVVDGVVVIVKAHDTPEHFVHQGLSFLKDVKANILGTVLLQTKQEISYYHYFKYYKYYSYYRYGYDQGYDQKEE